MQEVPHATYQNVHKNELEKYFAPTRSQTKTSGTVLLEVHGLDKGVNPSLRQKKQLLRPLSSTVQSHVPMETKIQIHVKPIVGQGRTDIKRRTLQKFPMPQ